jgi:hypothetical protein
MGGCAWGVDSQFNKAKIGLWIVNLALWLVAATGVYYI